VLARRPSVVLASAGGFASAKRESEGKEKEERSSRKPKEMRAFPEDMTTLFRVLTYSFRAENREAEDIRYPDYLDGQVPFY